jgi:hypothetical protein
MVSTRFTIDKSQQDTHTLRLYARPSKKKTRLSQVPRAEENVGVRGTTSDKRSGNNYSTCLKCATDLFSHQSNEPLTSIKACYLDTKEISAVL